MDDRKINESSPEFLLRMLGRLDEDYKYYLGNGGRCAKHLWAKDERKQIALMRKILCRLRAIFATPEWMTEQQIDDYAEQMLVF